MSQLCAVGCAGFGAGLAALAALPFLPFATAALVGVVASAMSLRHLAPQAFLRMPPWGLSEQSQPTANLRPMGWRAA